MRNTATAPTGKPKLSEEEFQRLSAKFERLVSACSEHHTQGKRYYRHYVRKRAASEGFRPRLPASEPKGQPLRVRDNMASAAVKPEEIPQEPLSKISTSPVTETGLSESSATKPPTSLEAAKVLGRVVRKEPSSDSHDPFPCRSESSGPETNELCKEGNLSRTISRTTSADSGTTTGRNTLRGSRHVANFAVDSATCTGLRRQRCSSGEVGKVHSPQSSPRRSLGENFNPFPTIRRPSLTNYASEVGIKLGLYSTHEKSPMTSTSNGSKTSSVKG